MEKLVRGGSASSLPEANVHVKWKNLDGKKIKMLEEGECVCLDVFQLELRSTNESSTCMHG